MLADGMLAESREMPPVRTAGVWDGNIFRCYELMNRWLANAAGRIDPPSDEKLCLFTSLVNACRHHSQA